MWPNTQETADLVTFTEEILNGKLQFLCSKYNKKIFGIFGNWSWIFLCLFALMAQSTFTE